MMELDCPYNRDDFLHFLEANFLTDFRKDIRPASTQVLSSIQKAYSLGRSERLDLQVFEFSFEGSPNKRVTLTKDAFQVMRSYAIFQALAIFHSPGSDDWRLSLMTATPERTEKGKVALLYSNPKRLSFFLGPNAKVNTPTKFLLKRGTVSDFDDLKSRFSIEVVNKEFYKEISGLFTQLVGGSIQNGKKMENYEALLKLPDVQDHSQTSLEFAVRLIGRVIFCWFLREKKSGQGKSLMPNDLLSLGAVKKTPDYYHSILEPIFFEVLNKPLKSRKYGYDKEPFSSIPYLNGGLFAPHDDDFFSYNGVRQVVNHNTVVIPDKWIRKFFEVLETYNFTIDENTGFDEELSIDPEMLGRIFENLLAEINPETGESARKSTGSYYTPRVIVDYMVDAGLLLYLKNQTQLDEDKLRAVISYDLNDGDASQLTGNERERIIAALEKVKILDPACGSGAFPIGALQKIVFILQQTDPEGHLWFKKQIKNTPPELRRVVEREFAHKNFDYIRKLGIIRENIYGVDIQPIATEISRLRCFLTLVVDERIQEDLENRGIEPLPNLDFKFVTANTLISLPGSQANSQRGLFEDNAGISELKELRDMFFNASGAERDQLKLQFVQAQNRMFQRLISDGTRGHADLTTKLTTWDPFSHKSASWFDPEWMFGVKDGFDILIANPPYGVNFSKTDKDLFAKIYEHQNYQLDSFLLFLEKGFYLLRKEGILSYIIPNTWLSNLKLKNIRKFIVSEKEVVTINHYHKKVFDATVDTEVVIIRNIKPNQNNVLIRVVTENASVKTHYIPQLRWHFLDGEPINIFLDDCYFQIINKLRKHSQLLGNICDVAAGMKPYEVGKGVPPQTKEMLQKRVYDSTYQIDQTYYPLLRGKDIDKYVIRWAGNRWIKYGENLAAPRKFDNFYSKQKIVIRQTGDSLIATLDTSQFICMNNLHTINSKSLQFSLKYILALLNSKLLTFYFRTLNPEQGEALAEVKKEHVEKLLIKDISFEQQKKYIDLVDEILTVTKSESYLQNPIKQAQVKKLETQIDQMVYKLYDLTDEEIRVVEEQTSARVVAKPVLDDTSPIQLTEQFIIS